MLIVSGLIEFGRSFVLSRSAIYVFYSFKSHRWANLFSNPVIRLGERTGGQGLCLTCTRVHVSDLGEGHRGDSPWRVFKDTLTLSGSLRDGTCLVWRDSHTERAGSLLDGAMHSRLHGGGRTAPPKTPKKRRRADEVTTPRVKNKSVSLPRGCAYNAL